MQAKTVNTYEIQKKWIQKRIKKSNLAFLFLVYLLDQYTVIVMFCILSIDRTYGGQALGEGDMCVRSTEFYVRPDQARHDGFTW